MKLPIIEFVDEWWRNTKFEKADIASTVRGIWRIFVVNVAARKGPFSPPMKDDALD